MLINSGEEAASSFFLRLTHHYSRCCSQTAMIWFSTETNVLIRKSFTMTSMVPSLVSSYADTLTYKTTTWRLDVKWVKTRTIFTTACYATSSFNQRRKHIFTSFSWRPCMNGYIERIKRAVTVTVPLQMLFPELVFLWRPKNSWLLSDWSNTTYPRQMRTSLMNYEHPLWWKIPLAFSIRWIEVGPHNLHASG